MKKACLKKNFLSDNIVNNINSYILKQERKNMYILLIVFIAILPITINSLYFNNKKENNLIAFSKGINIEKIKSYVNLYGENVNGSFNKNECIIKTSSEKLILDISNNDKYIITNIKKDTNNFYTVKVIDND